LYLNPEKQVYEIKDETREDVLYYCKGFADAIGKFTILYIVLLYFII